MLSQPKTRSSVPGPASVLVIALLLATIPQSSASIWPYIHVHITNELANETMLVHCKCSDHDLGHQFVTVGAMFEWRFKPHVFKKTHWRCYLAADKTRYMYFDAYNNGSLMSDGIGLEGDYNNLYYSVKEDGLYVRDADTGADNFSQGWDTVPS
ncbi:S-protein homolog 74 [Linum perenne]